MNILLLGFILACGEKAKEATPGALPESGAVIATVNGTNIHQNTVDTILSQFSEEKIKEFKASGGMEQIKEQLVMTEVLYQAALKANIHQESDVQVAMAMAQRGVLAEALVQSQAEKRASDDKIKSWYDEHLVQFRKNEADLSIIMVQTEEEGNAVKALLDGGADFAATAKEKSLDPRTKDNGGSMGKMDLRQLPPAMRTPIEAAEAGALVGPISLMGSWAVFKLNSKDTGVTPLEEVKDEVKENLMREESQAYVEEIRAAAKIEFPGDGAAKEEAKQPAQLDKEALKKDLNPEPKK